MYGFDLDISIWAYKVDVDCGLCVREGERKKEYHSGCARVCAQVSECIWVCMWVCFTLMSAQKGNTCTTAIGRSLPYAQETYKAQYKSAFLYTFNTFEAHTGIFYDVTGTDCWSRFNRAVITPFMPSYNSAKWYFCGQWSGYSGYRHPNHGHSL